MKRNSQRFREYPFLCALDVYVIELLVSCPLLRVLLESFKSSTSCVFLEHFAWRVLQNRCRQDDSLHAVSHFHCGSDTRLELTLSFLNLHRAVQQFRENLRNPRAKTSGSVFAFLVVALVKVQRTVLTGNHHEFIFCKRAFETLNQDIGKLRRWASLNHTQSTPPNQNQQQYHPNTNHTSTTPHFSKFDKSRGPKFSTTFTGGAFAESHTYFGVWFSNFRLHV